MRSAELSSCSRHWASVGLAGLTEQLDVGVVAWTGIPCAATPAGLAACCYRPSALRPDAIGLAPGLGFFLLFRITVLEVDLSSS